MPPKSPKAKAAKSPKVGGKSGAPAAANSKGGDKKVDGDMPTGAEDGSDDMARTLEPAPNSLEECFQNLNLEELNTTVPDQSILRSKVQELLEKVMPQILSSFTFYCSTNGKETVDDARRLRLAGYKKFVKDIGLASAGATPSKGKATSRSELEMTVFMKFAGGSTPELVQLTLPQTLSLLIHLAFYRSNVRYSVGKDGPKDVQVPVVQVVQGLVKEMIPKAKKMAGADFAEMMEADPEAQVVLTNYRDQLDSWREAILNKIQENGSDLLTEFVASLTMVRGI